MREAKTHEYRRSTSGRVYARITSSDGEELWRSRKACYPQFECGANQCKDMEAFIKLTNNNV